MLDRRTFLRGAGLAAAAAVVGDRAAGAGADAGDGSAAVAAASSAAARRIAGFAQAVGGPVFVPGQPGYAAAARVYDERFDSQRPYAVGRPQTPGHVQAAVRWAVGHGVPLRARSGGHSYAGYSTFSSGVVLDLRDLRGVRVDRAAGTATIGAGAQLVDVYAGLAAAGATLPSGSCPSVGIAGVTLGGGMGLAARAHGLTLDHLIGAQIATPDGRLRTVDARTDPDLLWALRGGGGGNFGVTTSFTYRVVPLPAGGTAFFVTWPWSSAAEAFYQWIRWAPTTDTRITSIFKLGIGASGEPNVLVSGQFLGAASDVRRLVSPLLGVRGANLASVAEAYLPLQLRWAGCAHTAEPACHTVGAAPSGALPRASFVAKSDYIDRPISQAGARALVDAVAARGRAAGSGAVLFDSYGGAINRVAPDATAFVHRDQLCAIQYLSYGGSASWLQRTWQAMRPYVSGQAYQNYIDASLPGWQRAYYAGNYPRLVGIQRDVDPHHFFNFPQAIGR